MTNEELQKNLDKLLSSQNEYTIDYSGNKYKFVKDKIYKIGNDSAQIEEIIDKKLICELDSKILEERKQLIK